MVERAWKIAFGEYQVHDVAKEHICSVSCQNLSNNPVLFCVAPPTASIYLFFMKAIKINTQIYFQLFAVFFL